MAKLFFISCVIVSLLYVGYNTAFELNIQKTTHESRIEASLNFK